MCVAVLLCVAAGAGETTDPVESRFRQLERDIPSLYLVNGLYLGAEQASEIAGLVEKAVSVTERAEERCERVMRAHERDLARQKNDVLAMVARRGEIEHRKLAESPRGERMRKAKQELAAIRKERRDRLGELADEAYETLTASQREIVDNFVPCFIPARDFRNPERVGQAAEDTSFVERILARLRQVPEGGDTAAALDRALDRLVPYAMKKKYMTYSEEAEQEVREELAADLRKALKRVKGMSDADFELDKGKIAAWVLPLSHPKKGDPRALRNKTERYMLNPGILDVLRARAGKEGGVRPDALASYGYGGPGGKAARTAQQELRTAGLVAGLKLSPGQAVGLLDIVRQAVETKEQMHGEIAGAMSEAFAPYSKLRSELAETQPTEEAENAANRCHRAVKMLRDDRLSEALLEHEAALDKMLTAGQVAFLAGGRTDGNPVRRKRPPNWRWQAAMAAAQSVARAGRVVSETRRMTPMSFAKKKDEVCREFVEWCVEHNELDPALVDVDSEVERTGEVLARARGLSESEYREERKNLAMELCPTLSGPRPSTYGSKYIRGEPVRVVSATTRLMFTDTAAELLAAIAEP